MVTLCGGEPTVSETVKVTLWRKESLFEGFGSDPPCGSVWVLRGNISAFCVAEREYWGGFIMKKRASSRRRKGWRKAMDEEEKRYLKCESVRASFLVLKALVGVKLQREVFVGVCYFWGACVGEGYLSLSSLNTPVTCIGVVYVLFAFFFFYYYFGKGILYLL
jgi:hypothetical protein